MRESDRVKRRIAQSEALRIGNHESTAKPQPPRCIGAQSGNRSSQGGVQGEVPGSRQSRERFRPALHSGLQRSNMLKEFKEFAVRGNVMDMAVGIVLGASFGGIVTSLVNDLLMPPIGLLMGRVDFSNLFISLTSRHFDSVAAAKTAGAATLNYGIFLNAVINFLIVSFAMFLVVRQVNRLRAPAPVPATP